MSLLKLQNLFYESLSFQNLSFISLHQPDLQVVKLGVTTFQLKSWMKIDSHSGRSNPLVGEGLHVGLRPQATLALFPDFVCVKSFSIILFGLPLSSPGVHTSLAPGFAQQDHARARDFNAAQGNSKDMEATLAKLLRKECQGISKARRPRRPIRAIAVIASMHTNMPAH